MCDAGSMKDVKEDYLEHELVGFQETIESKVRKTFSVFKPVKYIQYTFAGVTISHVRYRIDGNKYLHANIKSNVNNDQEIYCQEIALGHSINGLFFSFA